MKTIYLIRHSSPFVEYMDDDKMSWQEFNANMILSSIGEEKAKKLIDIDELKNIKNIYSASSARAIGTIKYLSEKNSTKIRIDKRINERELGINFISDLPDNFVVSQFIDRDLKYKNGESLNEVSIRFNNFINEILASNADKFILSIHGIVLMNYLCENTKFSFDGRIIKSYFNDKEILNGRLTTPDIYKIEYDNNKIINIDRIIF